MSSLFRVFVSDPAKTDGRTIYLTQRYTAAQVEGLRRTYAKVRAVPVIRALEGPEAETTPRLRLLRAAVESGGDHE